jgi:hypothetical protein
MEEGQGREGARQTNLGITGLLNLPISIAVAI